MAGGRAVGTGAGSGIGLATARGLGSEGAAVIGVDRRWPLIEPAISCLTADVTSREQVTSTVLRAAELLGGPADVLVNAAGVYRIRPLLDLTQDEWDETMAVNLLGPFLVGRAVAAGLAEAGLSGAIVNIGSTAALVADAAEPAAHYNASKAGVLALARQMAVEWAQYGIRANAVCPGVIDTPMLRLMDDPVAGQAYLEAGGPLRRLGTPDEGAAVIVFLGSPGASYLTRLAVPG